MHTNRDKYSGLFFGNDQLNNVRISIIFGTVKTLSSVITIVTGLIKFRETNIMLRHGQIHKGLFLMALKTILALIIAVSVFKNN